WEGPGEGSSLTDVFAAFLEDPAADTVQGLVIGPWSLDGRDSSAVVEALVAARERLPNLKALFLGDIVQEEQEISWIQQSDLKPILSGKSFLQLRYLGLRNSVIADEIAELAAQAPILRRLRVLDLSLGILTDRGAEALAASRLVAGLEKLDVHHHYVTKEGV